MLGSSEVLSLRWGEAVCELLGPVKKGRYGGRYYDRANNSVDILLIETLPTYRFQSVPIATTDGPYNDDVQII